MIAASLLHDMALNLDPVGSWWFLGIVTLALAAVLFAVAPDASRLSATGRLVLVLLRLGAFLALVAILDGPLGRSLVGGWGWQAGGRWAAAWAAGRACALVKACWSKNAQL